jgi:ABC-type antimicrobial peptide transport system permease subunit
MTALAKVAYVLGGIFIGIALILLVLNFILPQLQDPRITSNAVVVISLSFVIIILVYVNEWYTERKSRGLIRIMKGRNEL